MTNKIKTTDGTTPHQPEEIFARMASTFGYSVPKDIVARLVKADAADNKRVAVISELGINGVRRMAAEQDRAIVAAAEKGETLPHAVRTQPDMVYAIEQQQAALKENRATVNAEFWPMITKIWADFVATVAPKIDVFEDSEREMASRFGIAFEPSATLRALRRALTEATKNAQPPKNPNRLPGSPLACVAGLVQP